MPHHQTFHTSDNDDDLPPSILEKISSQIGHLQNTIEEISRNYFADRERERFDQIPKRPITTEDEDREYREYRKNLTPKKDQT